MQKLNEVTTGRTYKDTAKLDIIISTESLLLRSDKAVQFLVKAWVAKAYTLYSGM